MIFSGMAHSSRLKIFRIVPGAPARDDVLRRFSSKAGDLVAFSDGALKANVARLEDADNVNPLLFGLWVRKCAVAVGTNPLRLNTSQLVEESIGVALEELGEDSAFGSARSFPGTRKAIARTLTELGEAGVDAEGLARIQEFCGPTLRPKAEALTAIAARVEGIGRELGYGSLLEAIEGCLPLKSIANAPLGRALLIVGNEWFESARRFCEWFCERGGRLTILVDTHADGSASGFSPAQAVLTSFPEAAVETITDSASPFLVRLFGIQEPSPLESAGPSVRVLATSDPLSECEETLRGVRAALNEGVQPQRLAIYARDAERYGLPLEAASRRIGVNLSLPRRVPLLANGWIRFLINTLESLAGLDVRALLRPVSSSYLALSKTDKDATIEAIRNAYRDRNAPWETLEESNLPEPVMKLLCWRKEALRDRYTLAEWLGLLAQLRTDLKPDQDPQFATVERDTRAYFVLARALGARVSVQNLSGVEKLRLGAFVKICRDTVGRLDVSLPAGPGIAVVADAEALVTYERVWVLGLLEGQFPRRRSEDPILHDMDRTELATLGIHLKTSIDRAHAERDCFYRVASSAQMALTLSYPETDEDRDNIPAFYLEEATRAAGSLQDRIRLDRSRLAPPPEECNNDADRNLRNALDKSPKELPLPVEFETDLPMQALGRLPSWEPSVKDVRDVTRCPFQYFGRRLLGLRSSQMARRWAGLLQIPARGKLVSQPTAEAARASLLNELEEEISRIMPDATEWEVSAFRVGGIRLIDEWIEREFQARSKWRDGDVRHEVPLQEIDPEAGFRKLGVGGIAPAVTESAGTRLIHLYEGRLPDIETEGFRDKADLLYFGLILLAAYRPETRSMAIEIETQRDGRRVLVLPRHGNLTGIGPRMTIKDLSQTDQAVESIKLFSREVRTALDEAKAKLRTLQITPTPGDACAWCDLGELCRRSAKFSEEADPFEKRGLDEEN